MNIHVYHVSLKCVDDILAVFMYFLDNNPIGYKLI